VPVDLRGPLPLETALDWAKGSKPVVIAMMGGLKGILPSRLGFDSTNTALSRSSLLSIPIGP